MASKVKVNTIETESGSTLTLGQSGDTVTLPSGVTISGVGTVSWDTTAKTAAFTAVSGNGYFINTTSGAITMTLPASPSAGDIVSFKDYAGTFSTNNLTIGRNGSNLDGTAGDKAIDTDHTSMSLVYVDGTQGWKSVEEGTGFIGESFIVASGGTETTCGDYKIHTFTGPGCFSVSSLASTPTNNAVDYLVVAGGGGTQGYASGGGGGGGLRFSDCTWTAPSPVAPRAGTGITVTATTFPITVGGGGGAGAQGSTSTFSTISSAGGGKSDGGTPAPTFVPVSSGGSGGGGKSGATAGNGNTPPVTPSQGNPGGNGFTAPNGNDQGGGGGGAGASGTAGTCNNPGEGGNGLLVAINGSCTTYAGGGGAGGTNGPNAAGGAGGGGTGKSGPGARTPGTANTGGGAGGGQDNSATGGSGIVILRYKYQ